MEITLIFDSANSVVTLNLLFKWCPNNHCFFSRTSLGKFWLCRFSTCTEDTDLTCPTKCRHTKTNTCTETQRVVLWMHKNPQKCCWCCLIMGSQPSHRCPSPVTQNGCCNRSIFLRQSQECMWNVCSEFLAEWQREGRRGCKGNCITLWTSNRTDKTHKKPVSSPPERESDGV